MVIFISTLLAFVILSGVISFVRICTRIDTPARINGFWLFVSVFISAFFIRLQGVPHCPHIYFDEFEYLSVAQNILYHAKALGSIAGSGISPERMGFFTKPIGMPLLEAFFFSLTGGFGHAQYYLNMILGSLSCSLVGAIAWYWAKDIVVGWWAGIIIAFMPMHIKYSTCMAADVPAFFFFLLAVFFTCAWPKDQDRWILFSALFSAVYACYVKPVYLVFIVLGSGFLLFDLARQRLVSEKTLSDILWVFICLFLPLLFYFQPVILREKEVSGFGFFSLRSLFLNLPSNIGYFFNFKTSIVLAGFLNILGVWAIVPRQEYKTGKRACLWGACGFLAMSCYFSGHISYGNSDRYFLVLLLPYAFLSAQGVSFLFSKISYRPLVSGLFLVFLILNAAYAANEMAKTSLRQGPYLDLVFLKKIAKYVPASAYVLYQGDVMVMTQTSLKALSTESYRSGLHPSKLVYFKAHTKDRWIPQEDLINVLQRDNYTCRPLTARAEGVFVCDLKAYSPNNRAPQKA
ncbi:MAG: glycosyltransferase family 39 protein [Candidatus Omnitrophica bacterium]|nr:glycosyltransferase family 39 protein [Candidatus Omnitrophota bacterium]